MVRPRSKEKQIALLDAAANIVAEHGLEARTASIAKLAGVAEGSLFRYFATKDVLLNELYVYLKRSLADAMLHRIAKGSALEKQVRSLWDGYIDWGIAHPSYVKALVQLAVSEIISADTRSRVSGISPEVHEIAAACAAQGSLADKPAAFADAIFMALADATIQSAVRYPREAKKIKAAGFKVLWHGMTS